MIEQLKVQFSTHQFKGHKNYNQTENYINSKEKKSPIKYCSFHKSNGHNTSECNAKNSNTQNNDKSYAWKEI